jgi:hypothetical protein
MIPIVRNDAEQACLVDAEDIRRVLPDLFYRRLFREPGMPASPALSPSMIR